MVFAGETPQAARNFARLNLAFCNLRVWPMVAHVAAWIRWTVTASRGIEAQRASRLSRSAPAMASKSFFVTFTHSSSGGNCLDSLLGRCGRRAGRGGLGLSSHYWMALSRGLVYFFQCREF